MDNKRVKILLGIEAVLCLSLCWTPWLSGVSIMAAMAFPFAPLGRLLRWMSRAGGVGNVVAVILYILLCLIPAGFMLLRWQRHKLGIEDGLLVLMSVLLFFQMYLMVNPALLPQWLGPAAGGDMGGIILGGVFYSILVAYGALRVLRSCMVADGDRVCRYCAVLLGALAVVFVFAAFAISPGQLLAGIREVRAANQGNEHLLGLTYVFLTLRCLVSSATYLIDLRVLFTAGWLLDVFRREGAYAQETVYAAGHLSRRSAYALMITVLMNLAFQLLQLLFMRHLHTSQTLLDIPLLPLVLVLAAMLLAQYLREGKRLKDDNDLFI